MFACPDGCFCVLVCPERVLARSEPLRKLGSYQHFYSVISSGGGGNRTRVLQCLNGTSPSASGDQISGSLLATGTGREPQSTECSRRPVDPTAGLALLDDARTRPAGLGSDGRATC